MNITKEYLLELLIQTVKCWESEANQGDGISEEHDEHYYKVKNCIRVLTGKS